MSATVYVIEKNERDLLVFHQKTCGYVGDKVVDTRASYTTEAAFKIFKRVYPELAPCRQCCEGLANSVYTVANNSVSIVFNLENWLQKRKQCG